MRAAVVVVLGVAVVFGAMAACSSEPEPQPFPPDAGTDTDTDAGLKPDAGAEPDAGETRDAGEEPDAGEPDAGEPDAGPVDAGCPPDAGNPQNLVPNPGFECGDSPEGWDALGGTVDTQTLTVRTGTNAARLTTVNGGATLSLFPVEPLASTVGVGRFCAEAWAHGAPGTSARLSLSVNGTGGNVQSFSAPMEGTWVRLHAALNTTALNDELSLLVSALDPAPGAELFVDDVDVYRSVDGGCGR